MHVHTHVLSEWPPEQCAHIGPLHHFPMAVVAIYVVVAALACVLHVSVLWVGVRCTRVFEWLPCALCAMWLRWNVI